jgi:hypothetical protein
MSHSVSTDLRVAEFSALRSEIVAHQSAQTTLVGATLTAVGVVLGLVLTQKQTREELLLIIPLVASGLGLLYANHSRASLLIGDYIENHIWQADQQSWEHYLTGYRSSLKLVRLLEFMGGAAVFVLPSAGALIAALADGVWNDTGLLKATFWLGVGLATVHVLLTIVLAIPAARTYSGTVTSDPHRVTERAPTRDE